MTAHEEGIIRECAAAAQMARLHGCSIDVSMKRFGHVTTVKITPDGDVTIDNEIAPEDLPTQILPAKEAHVDDDSQT